MTHDPGISNDDSPTTILDKSPNHDDHETENDKYWRRGRWHKYGGKKPPMTPERTQAIEDKRAFEALDVSLADCLSGDELLAERKHMGDGSSFRFGGLGLRWLEALILCAVAYAMLSRFRRGLVATTRELGELAACVLEARGVTAVREALQSLVAQGLLTCDVTFVEFHAVWNQRGNLYRLTKRCALAFKLYVPEGVQLPEGAIDPTWAPRIARARALRNPEANPDLGRKREKNSLSSGMASASKVGIGCADADFFRTVVPGATPLPSQPVTRQASTCDVAGKAPDRVRVREILDEDLADLLGPCAEHFAKAGAL